MSRINFLFVLIIFLTACAPNATLAPLPTVTSSPLVIETATIAATPTPDPISPENMELLNNAGYTYHDKQLFVYGTNRILTLEGNEWVDEMGGRFKTEELQLIKTNSKIVDARGELRDVLILKREIDGVEKIFLPLIEQWQEPLDVVGSQQIIEQPDLPKSERGKWRDYREVKLDELPEMTWDDFVSGRLFYSEMNALKPWPENVRIPTLNYARLSMGTNVWVLTEYLNFDEIDSENERPILSENDGVIQNFDAFKMIDPITGDLIIVEGQQYLYKGYTVVLHTFFGGEYANTNSPNSEHTIVQRSLVNPPELITQPIVNIRNDGSDWCGVGGLGEGYADQASICALLGYGGLDVPRSVLPAALQQMISVFDTGVQLTGVANETYPVGDEIFKLQQLPLLQNSFFERHLDAYLLTEEDPLLDEFYPNNP